MYSVYKVTNKVNGKIYIGFTGRSADERWKGHHQTRNPKYPLQKAVKKYGKENFSREVIFTSDDRDEAFSMETFYIKKFKTNERKFGYNLTEGGEGMLGRRGEKHPMYGKTHSDEVKAELSRQQAELRASLPIYQPETLNLIHSLRKEGKPFRVVKEELDKRDVRTSRGSFYRSNKIIHIYKTYFPEISDEEPITDRKKDDWTHHAVRNPSKETRKRLSESVSKGRRAKNPLYRAECLELMKSLKEEGYTYREIGECMSVLVDLSFSKNMRSMINRMFINVIYKEMNNERKE